MLPLLPLQEPMWLRSMERWCWMPIPEATTPILLPTLPPPSTALLPTMEERLLQQRLTFPLAQVPSTTMQETEELYRWLPGMQPLPVTLQGLHLPTLPPSPLR